MRAFVRQVGSGVGEAVVAVLVAAVVGAVGLYAFSTVEWPAFNSSNVTRALTTVGQVGAAVLLVASVVLIRVRRWPWGAKVLAWAGISGFVTVTLGMPLAATKLYLFGISVDQEFRTEYLTRLTDSAALHDMTYAELPAFYPAGWFWLGGRVANLLGMAGWEAFKPWAIVSLSMAATLATVLWSKLIRADWAVAVGAATTAVMVAFAAPEAYSAVLVILFAPAMVLAWGALYRPAEWLEKFDAAGGSATARGWGAVVGTGLFVGVSGMFYTLFFAVAVFTVTLMAVLAWLALLLRRHADMVHRRPREGEPGALGLLGPILVRLIAIGAIAGALTLITWGPWLLRAARDRPRSSGGSALHYLPESGSRLPFPMFDFTHPLLGALCLLGTVWLVLRVGSSRRAQALSISVVAIYLWALASMAVTAAGTTLLAFRLEPILQVLLAAAGAFGFVEGARAIYQVFDEPARMRGVTAAVAVLGALAFTQSIPAVLATEITTAYTDTDGDGKRADQRNPSAVSHYRAIDEALLAQTGRPRDATVVLTADTSFLSYYPYYGFQALTSHYANPLADFPARAAEIERWSERKSPTDLLEALNHCPWRAPDAFLFRRGGDEYTLRLAEDVYPNDPNVRRYTVAFPKTLFEDPHFQVTDIGPFTLVVRR
ncbi:galactan 5-O-arabinofuranosyltransferase [Nocardia sp. CDC159]|uniref:Galactan 5-O-arabinofuranosyltransferase n=1 Tax=Nocardia pulmonis TaxID=2951408 RepID=A0A9X2EAV7_9NOCA|nr:MULTISPECIES: galactan 5-O-arabinofuranosyltransferase [Nocardia]MCM6776840.1 galactan 5-O-arabinofuranosyltransferase [Nocardia pulmonis]MCM6789264.1 galactan 5-O-arabinofuranosyltransferase [Nocardia sp. CDC159]